MPYFTTSIEYSPTFSHFAYYTIPPDPVVNKLFSVPEIFLAIKVDFTIYMLVRKWIPATSRDFQGVLGRSNRLRPFLRPPQEICFFGYVPGVGLYFNSKERTRKKSHG
jgi:hypothetical protein